MEEEEVHEEGYCEELIWGNCLGQIFQVYGSKFFEMLFAAIKLDILFDFCTLTLITK